MPWEVLMSNSRGRPYFLNRETNTSSWTTPPGLTAEEIKALPGAELLNERREEPVQVRASHLLVKHNGSRRPSSWKEANITRSKEEAIEILRQYAAQISGDTEKFAKCASANSDCSSHSNGGDLGWFGRGQMQKPFEDATYALPVGQISEITSTESGVHLILRTG